MILMDSDHVTVYRLRTTPRAIRLTDRLTSAGDPVIGTTIVNVEEAMRGWMAAVAKERQVRRQVIAYRRLAELFGFFAGMHIALLTDEAAERFEGLRASKVRIGTRDLKTAAIALTHNALLLTANRQDFEQVPGLRFENWLD